MKKIGNALYITNPEAHLALEGDAIVISVEEKPKTKLPLINIDSIVCFTYVGVSPSLMGACVERQISLTFLTPNGRFLANVGGSIRGNVLLRKHQFVVANSDSLSLAIAKNVVLAKIYNQRKVIERTIRDHSLVVNVEKLTHVSTMVKDSLKVAKEATSAEELIAIEGFVAKNYFSCFDEMTLQQKPEFYMEGRTRRPPLDRMNALLSFLYVLLTNETKSALEGVGLDPFFGFLHKDRPGRPSLALDMMEEFRPLLCDRLALNLVNRRQINSSGFLIKETGAVLMDDDTRKKVLVAWQDRKKQEIVHPFLKEKVPYGLLPHVQSLLLSRHLRGDLDAYPPFFME
jgi:CRISPR-associated protein Cas1